LCNRRTTNILWWLQVTNEEVLRRVNEDKHWILFSKGNFDGSAMIWDKTDFCMKLLKAE